MADGGGNKCGRSPHALFHLTVHAGYRQCSVVFAFSYCRDLVTCALQSKGEVAVKQFLTSAESSSPLGSLRGHLFERLALATLCSPASDRPLRRLGGVGAEAVSESFSLRNLVVVDCVDELQAVWANDPSAVGRPRAQN